MIIELIRKELLFRKQHQGSKWIVFAHAFLKLIGIGLFMVLEWFIFSSIDEKVNKYSDNASYSFLLMFLFAIVIFSILSSAIRARSTIFSNKDARIILTLPVSSETLVIAKMLYIYIKEVAITFVLSSPILLSYGITRGYAPYFYVFTIFYPLIICLFTVSFSLIFVIVFEYVYRLLKLSSIAQFICACVVVIGVCYLYQFVLQMFLNALNDSSIGGMFSPGFINALEKITQGFFPITPLFNSLILRENVFSNVMIFIGILMVTLVIGVFIASSVYAKYSKTSIVFKVTNNKERHLKVEPLLFTLLKKEFILLFKERGNIFSYTALLIMAPFLSYVVISSMQLILYRNMEFVLIYFPELINGLNLGIILLFVGVINSSASLSISREGKALQIMKYIPVSPFKQIVAKVLCPFVFSSLSLILVLIVLLTTNSITFVTFIIALIIGLILIYSNNVLGILWDMCDKGNRKFSLRFLNAFLGIGFPFIIVVIHLALSAAFLDAIFIYMIEISLSLVLLGACFFKIKKRFLDAFINMEVN